ncbi:MAG: hypothetical protein JO209_07145 [Acidisphaera sp.]|nr:hypothetical protein [Acidisphaera sp.]
MRHHVLIGLLALAGLARPAAAQEHPPYLPTRDVAVTYRIARVNQTGFSEAHLYFSASADKGRLEQEGATSYGIVDPAAKRMTIVMLQRHAYLELPYDIATAPGFVLSDRMTFTRAGTATIAGLACTVWTVQSDTITGTACVTADGVLLHGQGHDRKGNGSDLLATAVDYAAQPATLFDPPADFQKVVGVARPAKAAQ